MAKLSEERPEDEICPVCGYYCLGKGGVGCIDKPTYVEMSRPAVAALLQSKEGK